LTEKKIVNKAFESLNEIYNPRIPNLDAFGVNLSTYLKKNNEKERLIVELRKVWSVDLNNSNDKNKLFIKKLLSVGYSGKPIIAEITIECKDVFRQKLKLKQQGLI